MDLLFKNFSSMQKLNIDFLNQAGFLRGLAPAPPEQRDFERVPSPGPSELIIYWYRNVIISIILSSYKYQEYMTIIIIAFQALRKIFPSTRQWVLEWMFITVRTVRTLLTIAPMFRDTWTRDIKYRKNYGHAGMNAIERVNSNRISLFHWLDHFWLKRLNYWILYHLFTVSIHCRYCTYRTHRKDHLKSHEKRHEKNMDLTGDPGVTQVIEFD